MGSTAVVCGVVNETGGAVLGEALVEEAAASAGTDEEAAVVVGETFAIGATEGLLVIRYQPPVPSKRTNRRTMSRFFISG